MPETPEYKAGFQRGSAVAAVASTGITAVVVGVIYSPVIVAAALTPGGGYAIAEGVSTGVEIATGYDGPPIIPGPGDPVRMAVQSARDAAQEGAEIVVKHGDEVAAPVARVAGDGADVATDTGQVTKEIKTRPTKGGDGATSELVIERDSSGEVISTTHKVTKGDALLHQHQDHQGKHGGERRFPDEWVEHPQVNAPEHTPRAAKDNQIKD